MSDPKPTAYIEKQPNGQWFIYHRYKDSEEYRHVGITSTERVAKQVMEQQIRRRR
jgi:hypothetical protein